jgi:hypothetical protein
VILDVSPGYTLDNTKSELKAIEFLHINGHPICQMSMHIYRHIMQIVPNRHRRIRFIIFECNTNHTV